MQNLNLSGSPPRAPPIKYIAPLGTRWEKEMAAAGGATAFDLPTDPKTIGPWILGECVGKGASGRVKIAKHHRTGQLAAVKILPIAPLVTSRASLATQQAKSDKLRLGIDREITMMKLMSHPNIMRIYDVYEGDNELFLVLEYVEGGELFDFLVNMGKFPPDEALIYFRQIVYGLNYAHTFSIIHRDLKPENILIASLSPPLVKIADWGMAAFAPPSLQLETSCGSPHYASPEIVKGEKYQGNATDIWSCGVILYALLTGRLPFDDKDFRTLLTKVQSGIYEMPTWIDPLAQDLISRMLVVDVKQRITIPQILSHPWLTSQPAIPFSAYDGKAYTILPPPLPPSPRVLARPIASPKMIDPELFSSLRIIWGQHADPNGDCIRRDLCSPAGQGVYAKAFYFLLDRYREESFKNSVVDTEFDSWITPAELGLGTRTLASLMATSESPASMTGGLRRYEVSNVFLNSQVARTVQSKTRRASANPAKVLIGPKFSSRKRTFTEGSISAGKGRLDPVIAPHPIALQKGQTKSQIPTPQKDSTSALSFRAQSAALSGLGRGIGAPPFPPRRGYMLPDRGGDSNIAPVRPSPRFSQQLQQLQDKTKGIASSAKTASSNRPFTSRPLAETSKITPGTAKTVMNSDPRPSVGSPRFSVTSKGRSPMHPTNSGKEEIPIHSPITVEEITKLVSDQNISETPVDVYMAKEGKKSNIPLAKMRRYRKLREQDDKENQEIDEGWSQVTSDSGGVGLGVGDVPNDRDIGKEMGNLPISLAKMKKSRPPPLELLPKRSTLAMLGSPIAVSSPIQVPSSANRSLTSPAVSDFKVWFSSLFNWKTSNANGGILYSPDDLLVTRNTVTRILEGMGVVVSKGQSDRLESGEVLLGRIDNPSTDPVSGLPIKNIRFRIEFKPSETSETQYAVGEDAPYFPPSLRHNVSALGSPVTPVNVAGAAAGPLSSRPRTSFLLGGRSVSHGTPLPSPALVSASTKGDSNFPPGCLCAVALVYEKGSMSTFKLLWRRLKDVYGEVVGGYPCLSPAIPNTPYVENYRGMMV